MASQSMDELHIRPATTSDLEDLVTVYRSAYRENREIGFPAKAETASADDVQAWMDDDGVFVALLGDRILGAVRIEETAPERLKISRLGVHEDSKGRGIGSALLDHAEQHARDEGYETVWLTTPEAHPYLGAFYRDRGYVRTGDYPLDYREYDEVVMEKSISDE